MYMEIEGRGYVRFEQGEAISVVATEDGHILFPATLSEWTHRRAQWQKTWPGCHRTRITLLKECGA